MKLFVAVFALMAVYFTDVNAECCGANECTPFRCCGKISCNMFCCNCGGKGCKDDTCCPRHLTLSSNNQTTRKSARDIAENKFKTIDTDSSNQISLDEVNKYLNFKSFDGKTPKWFTDMDLDNNGYVSRSEFDDTLS